MEKKVIAHVFVDCQVDFFTGRLANPHAQAIVPYLHRASEAILANIAANDPIFAKEISMDISDTSLIARASTDEVHAPIIMKDVHPATEEGFLATAEGKAFPHFHCPAGDPGSDLIPELEALEDYAIVIEKDYIFTPEIVEALDDLEYQIGRIDEVHFYGVLTSMCVLGAVVQVRSDFPELRLIVHAKGTADTSLSAYAETLLILNRNFVEIRD